MKTLLFCILLLSSFLTNGTEIALIGIDNLDTQIATLAVSKLSEEFDFVERQQIYIIKKELEIQKNLSMAMFAQKFAGANLFAVIEKGSLTIFETNCGFRLNKSRLSTNSSKAISLIREKIAIAIKQNNRPENARFISVAAVRNNLHSSLEKKAQVITKQLLDQTDQLDAIMLERNYLIELLLEKKLTGKWGKAIAASEILHFELNSGEKANSIVIAAYFSDAKENILFKEKTNNISKLFQKIKRYLKQEPLATNYTLKTESERFAREAEIAKNNGDNLDSLKQSFAAFVLDGENSKYLNYNLFWRDNISPAYPYWRAEMQYYIANDKLNYESKEKIVKLLRTIYKNHYELSNYQREQHQELLKLIRNKIINLNDVVQLFCDTKEYLYCDKTFYMEAKLSAWDKILTHAPENINKATRFVLMFMSELPKSKRQKWVDEATLRLTWENGKVLQKIIQFNALLYSRDYTLEKATTLFSEYCDAANNSKEGVIEDIYYFCNNVRAYPLLEENIKKILNKYKKDSF